MNESLLTTKVEDMTVGDSLKLQAYIVAAMATVGGVLIGGGIVKDKFSTWRRNRKVDVAIEETETTE